MIKKHPIVPRRLRRIPTQFSWVDHRLVRDRHIKSCSHPGAALYLFLVTVADQEGLSYYSDASLMSSSKRVRPAGRTTKTGSQRKL